MHAASPTLMTSSEAFGPTSCGYVSTNLTLDKQMVSWSLFLLLGIFRSYPFPLCPHLCLYLSCL
ncbi:hypothetical protein B296_00044441 [Ensete ventricosum]|uniref:Uncharacterized protein n=1 Tax=Ensete ventricosum TaxID=4639 RepID=A0A426XWH0_ENSVE|nr:hypothetical protein B296_00044441 [Ensete ventricosum]